MTEPREPLPLVGITLGDPAGIGAEVILKALQRPVAARLRPLVIGDLEALRRGAACTPHPFALCAADSEDHLEFAPARLNVLDPGMLQGVPYRLGEMQAACGRAAVHYLLKGISLAKAGKIDALVTAPLNKESMHLAGYRYAGHTEILAAETGAESYAMMLVVDELRVLHVSTHVSLREAIERVQPERILEVIRLAGLARRRLGLRRGRIAVAGLNPHAGEGGLFGDEEERFIRPAVERARAEGLDATGPLPPDTVLHHARRGDYDFVVAMYHDQGHIPLKLLGFDRGVNVTLGLPIIRTSVDHGTAFDIAGKGIADPTSMERALEVALQMIHNG